MRGSILYLAFHVLYAALLAALVFLIFSRLLGVGFFHDDWTFLARATGGLPPPDVPHRPLAFDFYWRLLGSMFGSEPAAYAYSRFVIHIVTGFLLARLGHLLKFSTPLCWLLGVVYSVSPLAFEPLYWASGVTDLLANLGLVMALLGGLRGGRIGALVFLIGGAMSLASKETGWWLCVAGVIAWRQHRCRGYLWSSVLLPLGAALAVASVSQALGADFSWSLRPVVTNWLRVGSWLAPRPDDLIRVWEPDAGVLFVGALVWTSWFGYAVYRWRRKDKVPAASLLCAILAIAPTLGLDGAMVPRYLLPALAALAITMVSILHTHRRVQNATAPIVFAATILYTIFCVDQLLDRTYPLGRPAHRMVAKERMVRMMWDYLHEHGVDATTGVVFYCRPTDDVAMREYMLDVIGRDWGPGVVLGAQARVLLAEHIAQIPPETPVFQFGFWSLQYLGVLSAEP